MPLDISQLPPKPDPLTGEPRPPAAPLESGTKGPSGKLDRGKEKVPKSPEGQGPMLEWFYPDRTTRVISGLVLSAICALVYVIKDMGFSWVTTWWLWLILVPWPFVFMWSGRNARHSAGAEWLAYGRGSWVRLYELTSIKVTIVSGGMARKLELEDSGGRSLWVQIDDLQSNPKLWDLVYNGLIHSVHGSGAETNKRARDWLRLENPPTVQQSWW